MTVTVTITETAGAAQSAAALKRELADVSAAKNELTAREHALGIQIGVLEVNHEDTAEATTRKEEREQPMHPATTTETIDTPDAHTLVTGPYASGKTTALRALATEAELAGHRVLAIDGLSTARSIARQIAAELEQLEQRAQPGPLVIAVDDLHNLRGGAFNAVAEAALLGASARIRVVATAATGRGIKDVSGRIAFDRVITLARLA